MFNTIFGGVIKCAMSLEKKKRDTCVKAQDQINFNSLNLLLA